MSCLLSSTIFDCEEFSLGGVSKLFIANWSQISNVYFNTGDTQFSTVQSIIPTTITWYQFQVNPFSTGAIDTMSESLFGRSYKHTFTTTVMGLTPDKRDVLNQLIKSNNLVIVFKDANDVWWIMGEDKPLKVSEYTSKTGINKDDFSSYTFTLSNTTKYKMRAINEVYVNAYISPVYVNELCDCESLLTELLIDIADCTLETLAEELACPLS